MITDISAVIKFANTKFSEMLGYTIEELVGIDSFLSLIKLNLKRQRKELKIGKRELERNMKLNPYVKLVRNYGPMVVLAQFMTIMAFIPVI